MFLIDEILKYDSLSIVGLEKNTGKTECLNYILRGLKDLRENVVVTSIGVDGEKCDQIYKTSKPEIEIFEGMYFVTTEKYYQEKRLTAEIIEVDDTRTTLGRLVVARAVNSGKVVLSGPVDTVRIKQMTETLLGWGMDRVIIDGALSRLCLGAPTVTKSMILATGAALSGNIMHLVRKTKFVYDLICLPEVDALERMELRKVERGVWAIDEEGKLRDLEIVSGLATEGMNEEFFRYGHRFYVSGAVGNNFLSFLKSCRHPVELIVRDFTRIFASSDVFYAFLREGMTMKVLKRSRLLAICINPQSPEGFVLDSEILCEALRQEVSVPVVDVRKMGDSYVI